MNYIYINVYLDSVESNPVQRVVALKEDAAEAINYINSLTKEQIIQTGISILDSVKESFPKKYYQKEGKKKRKRTANATLSLRDHILGSSICNRTPFRGSISHS